MAKTITIKLKKSGSRLFLFSLWDDRGNLLGENIPKDSLIKGMSYSVDDEVKVVKLVYSGPNCCDKTVNIPVTTLSKQEKVDISYKEKNTSSLWKHLENPTLYNSFYGCIHPYILEYPFAFQYRDEVVQNIQDYTKAYTYISGTTHKFDGNRKIQTDDKYFNKAVLYNDQQSSGVLYLVAKPLRNMKEYMSFPKFHTESKSIIYTKSDNFYQFNTFWNVVKDVTNPLFISSCESLSIDKEVNQDNMEYSSRAFKKDMLRAKDLRVRLTLDDRSDVHLVSQFLLTSSQNSYK